MKVQMEIALRKRTPGPVRRVLMDSPTQSYMLFVDVFFFAIGNWGVKSNVITNVVSRGNAVTRG